jgi:digeranylgeranylglycerophospholipid reductase
MLHRDRFDRALATLAEEAGARVWTRAEATGLLRRGSRWTGLRVWDHRNRREATVEADLVVGADGVEAWVGRWAGLRSSCRLGEIHSCYQLRVRGPGFEPGRIEFYCGRETAPGGYAWIFPKEDGTANVGVGVHPGLARASAARYLRRFLRSRLPRAEPVGTPVVGGTTGMAPLRTMVDEGLLLVGEAAAQNNPFTGGGIMNALEGAEEAAGIVLEAFRKGDLSAEKLREYDRRWQERNGRQIARLFKLRRMLFVTNDGEMDAVARVLQRFLRDRPRLHDPVTLFRDAFVTAPRLVWKARRWLL